MRALIGESIHGIAHANEADGTTVLEHDPGRDAGFEIL